MNRQKRLVVILGPTAVGKSDLAVRVAQHYHTEIVSADSRQFFKELNIGVARPSLEELNLIPHHFIAFISITDVFSAGMYERAALELLHELFLKHDTVVCCGGSMLYVDALLNGLDELPGDEKVRGDLIKLLESEGIEVLQKQLQELDPKYYDEVDKLNSHRLIRALEVCSVTGQPFSSLRKETKKERTFQVIKIGMSCERNWLYDRINRRVDMMMSDGLEEEAKSVIGYRHLNALNTVGYKELFQYFDGEYKREIAIDKLKQHTRNFAKRQMTWWKRGKEINWINAENSPELLEQVIKIVEQKVIE